MNVPNEIKKLLDSHNIKYKSWEHEPTPTSELAAKVRGVPLSQGAKALVFRSKGVFFMAVIRADLKVDFNKLKKLVGVKKLSMASAEEVSGVTHCIPGGVPPFGNLFDIPVYLDSALTKNDTMDFNCGLQTCSIEMKVSDYVKTVKPIVGDFARS